MASGAGIAMMTVAETMTEVGYSRRIAGVERGEGETLSWQMSCPVWPSSPPVTGEGVRKMSFVSRQR